MCYLTCKRSRAVDRSRERGDSQLWLLQATHSLTRRQAGAVNWFLPGMWMILSGPTGWRWPLQAGGFPCKCYALPTGCGFRRRPGLLLGLVAIGQDTRSVWKPDPGPHASSRHALADRLAFAPRTAGGERRDPQLCLYRQDQLSLITGLSLKFHVNPPPGM